MWLIDWFKTNSDTIVTFLTSANFIAIITMIVKFILGLKQTTSLKDKVNNLADALSSIADTKDTIDGNTKINSALSARITALETSLNANNKSIEAILSVMGIVYMRSKDEDVRSSVASILSTFKTGDITIRNLKLELEELREQLAKATESTTTITEETAETASTTVSNDDANTANTTETVIMRG